MNRKESINESLDKKYNDRWVKCIAKGGNLCATAVFASGLVQEAKDRHQLGHFEAKALGEALIGGLLLASNSKIGERLSLSVKGSHTLKQAVVDAAPEGTVRGFISTRESTQEPVTTLGPWQEGLLSVVRQKPFEKEPYVGTVPLVTGHLAKDITFYLSQSEQIPSAVGIVMNIRTDGTVKDAVAFLVQIMPGASESEISMIEKNISQMDSFAEEVSHLEDPLSVLEKVFHQIEFIIIETKPIKYECNCSKERVVSALKLLGNQELTSMIQQDHGAAVRCDFCCTDYIFNQADLESYKNAAE